MARSAALIVGVGPEREDLPTVSLGGHMASVSVNVAAGLYASSPPSSWPAEAKHGPAVSFAMRDSLARCSTVLGANISYDTESEDPPPPRPPDDGFEREDVVVVVAAAVDAVVVFVVVVAVVGAVLETREATRGTAVEEGTGVGTTDSLGGGPNALALELELMVLPRWQRFRTKRSGERCSRLYQSLDHAVGVGFGFRRGEQRSLEYYPNSTVQQK